MVKTLKRTRVVGAGVLLAEQVVVLVLRQQQAALAHAAQLGHHAVHKAHLRARARRSARESHCPPQQPAWCTVQQ